MVWWAITTTWPSSSTRSGIFGLVFNKVLSQSAIFGLGFQYSFHYERKILFSLKSGAWFAIFSNFRRSGIFVSVFNKCRIFGFLWFPLVSSRNGICTMQLGFRYSVDPSATEYFVGFHFQTRRLRPFVGGPCCCSWMRQSCRPYKSFSKANFPIIFKLVAKFPVIEFTDNSIMHYKNSPFCSIIRWAEGRSGVWQRAVVVRAHRRRRHQLRASHQARQDRRRRRSKGTRILKMIWLHSRRKNLKLELRLQQCLTKCQHKNGHCKGGNEIYNFWAFQKYKPDVISITSFEIVFQGSVALATLFNF